MRKCLHHHHLHHHHHHHHLHHTSYTSYFITIVDTATVSHLLLIGVLNFAPLAKALAFSMEAKAAIREFSRLCQLALGLCQF